MSGNEKREPLIQVQNLGKSFGNIEVLKDITVDIYKGDVVFVVGPSGSGKSTFLRCLNRLEEPTKGHIYFEGTDITDPKVDINRHRQKIGMVFQQFNLLNSKTVYENLTDNVKLPYEESLGTKVTLAVPENVDGLGFGGVTDSPPCGMLLFAIVATPASSFSTNPSG